MVKPLPPRWSYLYLRSHYFDETWSSELTSQVRPYVDEVLTRIDDLRWLPESVPEDP